MSFPITVWGWFLGGTSFFRGHDSSFAAACANNKKRSHRFQISGYANYVEPATNFNYGNFNGTWGCFSSSDLGSGTFEVGVVTYIRPPGPFTSDFGTTSIPQGSPVLADLGASTVDGWFVNGWQPRAIHAGEISTPRNLIPGTQIPWVPQMWAMAAMPVLNGSTVQPIRGQLYPTGTQPINKKGDAYPLL